jgi:hypothetical protein
VTGTGEDARIRKTRVIDLDLFLERADEEVILIVLSHESRVGEPVDIELVVTRPTAGGWYYELPGIDHTGMCNQFIGGARSSPVDQEKTVRSRKKGRLQLLADYASCDF